MQNEKIKSNKHEFKKVKKYNEFRNDRTIQDDSHKPKKIKNNNFPKFYEIKKIERCIYSVIYLILIFLLVNNIIYFVNIAFTKKDYLSFNNVSFLIVNNDIKAFRGSNNDKYYNDNDIICYEIDGYIKICRIINIYTDPHNGKKYYVTKYDNNIHPNAEKIERENIIGKKIFTIKFIGKLIKFSHTKFVFILEAIVLVIIFKINNERQKKYNKLKGKHVWKYDRVKETLKIVLGSSVLISTIAFILFQTIPDKLISIFGSGD